MIPTCALVESLKTPKAVAYAYTPTAVVDLIQEAVLAVQAFDGYRPLFSALQLLGVYLGGNPTPAPLPENRNE